jgi:hypothetical protein
VNSWTTEKMISPTTEKVNLHFTWASPTFRNLGYCYRYLLFLNPSTDKQQIWSVLQVLLIPAMIRHCQYL